MQYETVTVLARHERDDRAIELDPSQFAEVPATLIPSATNGTGVAIHKEDGWTYVAIDWSKL